MLIDDKELYEDKLYMRKSSALNNPKEMAEDISSMLGRAMRFAFEEFMSKNKGNKDIGKFSYLAEVEFLNDEQIVEKYGDSVD
jgi:hypothetical protein